MDSDKPERGWGKPWNAKKWHYFDGDTISLCGKWWYLGERDDTLDDPPDNCVVCMKKKVKLEKKNE